VYKKVKYNPGNEKPMEKKEKHRFQAQRKHLSNTHLKTDIACVA
jgi:hypothetical protein